MPICSPPNLVSLPEQIANAIARSIMKSEIAPGGDLREIPLAKVFGVSRSSVREALRILERDGVVTIRPRHGAKVTELTPNEMAEIYQIRAALLGVAFDLYASQCKPDDLVFLENILASMESITAEHEQAHAFIHAELSADMATYICERCGNSKLANLLKQMSLQIARYTKLGLSAKSRRKQSIENWRRALDAFGRSDTAGANQLGQKMVNDNLAYALSVLQGSQAPVVDGKKQGRK